MTLYSDPPPALSFSPSLYLTIYLPLFPSSTPLLPLLYTSTSRFSIRYSADRHLLAAFCPRLAFSCFQGVPLSSLSIACHLTVLGYSPRFTFSLFADFFRRVPFFFCSLFFSFFFFNRLSKKNLQKSLCFESSEIKIKFFFNNRIFLRS